MTHAGAGGVTGPSCLLGCYALGFHGRAGHVRFGFGQLALAPGPEALKVPDLLNVRGVAQEQPEVVVDRALLVLAAVVRGVPPAHDGRGEVFLREPLLESALNQPTALRVEDRPGLAGRFDPSCEHALDGSTMPRASGG